MVFDREFQERDVKTERSWAGAICCFLLFIVLFLTLMLHIRSVLRVSSNAELGLLLFLIPGAISSFFSTRRRRVLCPLIGAVLAAPICLMLAHFILSSERSFWQELAWVFSAVFWCALGALGFLFVNALLHDKHREDNHSL